MVGLWLAAAPITFAQPATSVSTAPSKVSSSLASERQAAVPSAPCNFGVTPDCESTDPTISVLFNSFSSTSGCTFNLNINWGDGSSIQNVLFVGGPEGLSELAGHTYSAPDVYTITVTGEVASGPCYFDAGTFTFTWAPSVPWASRSGEGTAISVGANGAVWLIGTNPTSDGDGIYGWTGTGWAAQAGGAVTVAVGPEGNPWVLNSTHHIYHWNGHAWSAYPGEGTSISVGTDGAVWLIGTNPTSNGDGIYRWTGTGWAAQAGGAVTVAVGPDGNPWVLNSTHHIYHWNGHAWSVYTGAGTDISVGANGAVWLIGTNPVSGGDGIYQRTATGWAAQAGGAVTIAVGPQGNPWVLNSTHHIYSS